MSYRYVYKRGDERNPIPDYHKKYIEVQNTKVMTTRYTYEIALSKHWPDHSECTGPRGGKAVREFARYVWYANGMFYAVKRQLVGENKFGNALVPLSGVIWDCHKRQSESQGIPVVEITIKNGKPVSVLMDGENVEVTEDTWPIAEELLYLNGARCPRSPNKQPSKPRKRRAAKRAEPKAASTPTPKPITRPENEFMETFEPAAERNAGKRRGNSDCNTEKALYVAFSELPYKFWEHETDATMLLTNDKARLDKFVAKNNDAITCKSPNEIENDECYARLAVSFMRCGGKLNLYGYDQDKRRIVSHKFDNGTTDDELLATLGRMFGSMPYLKYEGDKPTGTYEIPANCAIKKPLSQRNPKRSDSKAAHTAYVWLNNKRIHDEWMADYCKRTGRTEKEVMDEIHGNWVTDYARFGIETPDRLGTFDGYRLSECGDRGLYFYTVVTPWGMNEGLWTPDYRDDEYAIELLKEVITIIDESMGIKAAA